jgi:hypothetical protein
VTRAYRRAVFGGGPGGPTEGLRSRVARGRPNWWVILAVSLGLMALLVATAGGAPRVPQPKGGPSEAAVHIAPGPGLLWSAGAGGDTGGGGSAKARTNPNPNTTTTTPTTAIGTTTTTTATVAQPSSGTAEIATTHLTSGTAGVVSSPPAGAPSVTTTTAAAPTTTTTAGSTAVPADRTQTQGYLNPPGEPSNKFGFAGTGPMQISVVWSGNTYLTMQVSCANGGQNVGGTAAMAASLPDASGGCLATVSEPTSETTSLTYTISIGPAGG